MRVAYTINAEMPPARAQIVAAELVAAGWTEAELRDAARRIVSDPEIARQVSFAGTICPYHFTLARPAPSRPSRWCATCGQTTNINEAGVCPACE